MADFASDLKERFDWAMYQSLARSGSSVIGALRHMPASKFTPLPLAHRAIIR